MVAATIIVAAVILAAAMLAAASYFLRNTRRSAEPPVYHARCPGCSQKVRYVAFRSGRRALCPRCKKHLNLPATPQPLAKLEVSGLSYGLVRR